MRTDSGDSAGTIYNRLHVGGEAGVQTSRPRFTAVLPYLGIAAALAELDALEMPPGATA